MRGYVAILSDDLANVLVSVMGVEISAAVGLPHQRARGDGFGWIPDVAVGVGSWSCRIVAANLEVTVVEEALGVLRASPAHVVVGRRCLAVADRASIRLKVPQLSHAR